MAGITDFLGGSTGSLIGAGLGLLAGGSSGGNEASSTKTLDPRIAKYIYGADGNSGLLGDASSIYSQQMQNGGLNDMQRQGLDMRSSYLQSPQYTNSYQSMMNQGMGLMNAPVAGNPFTRAQQGAQAPSMPSGGYEYKPSQVQAPMYRPDSQTPQTAAPAAPTYGGIQSDQGGQGVNGSGGQANDGGQGISSDTTKAALAAMAAAENPAIRALFPTIAALLGVGGSAVAGQQADAMGSAGNKLAASQPLANLGIGTVSDVDGNVRTYSSPSTIAAADAATFGQGGGYDQTGRDFGGFGNGSFGEGEY